ncbi:hypothetical protein BD408DRAFT_71410 [Parasitella parasitica]|nr:hypothetical protein BD408DRAFT_71410 [Parasitella parasitica]
MYETKWKRGVSLSLFLNLLITGQLSANYKSTRSWWLSFSFRRNQGPRLVTEQLVFFSQFVFQFSHMEASVPRLQLTHLVLEGAAISLCIELVVKTVFLAKGQKTYLVRALKITMAVAMIVKSSIFAVFSSTSLMHHCLLTGRIADSFYHVSCLAHISILLLQRYALFNFIHILIFILRSIVCVYLRYSILAFGQKCI